MTSNDYLGWFFRKRERDRTAAASGVNHRKSLPPSLSQIFKPRHYPLTTAAPARPRRPRRDRRFILQTCPSSGKSPTHCPALLAKILPFSFHPNHFHSLAIPAHTKGRFAIVTDVGLGMRWTRVVRLTRALSCGRRSRVVLTPRRWRQVGDDASASRRRWWQKSPVTRESAEETVKTIAQGRPGVPVDLW